MCSPTYRVALVILSLAAMAGQSIAQDRRPNIILILADDLGYSDVGCYGGEIRTPNIDSLARNGLRFSQFYNGGRCCPTRASLLTGLHPHQAGVGRMTMDAGRPGYRGFLRPNTVTIAEVLKNAGYRTGMVGKWHLSLTREGPGHMKHLNNQQNLETFSDVETYPVGRGFDYHYGIIWGVVNFFDPFSLVRNREAIREVPEDYYITDALSDEAVRFVEAHGEVGEQKGKPFFLYLAHTAPHWPLHALEEDIRKYEKRYAAGWDDIRNTRRRRLIEEGLIDAGTTIAPAQGRKSEWEQNETKQWDARAMAVHAAMIDRMDQGIGRLIDTLRKQDQLDHTLILFLSDNGASPEAYPNPGFDRPSETRDGRKITYPPDKTVPPGGETTFFGYGPAWANVSNVPFRFWKAEMYEGGICTPMIVHWPNGLKTEGGGITEQTGHVIDVMATCLEAAGAAYPKTVEGREITPMAGKSLMPILRGEERRGHNVLAWEHFGARAVRVGPWKLVARRNAPWELYDLSKDRTEMQDLAGRYPDRVKQMETEWWKWAESSDVLPAPDNAIRGR